MARTNNASFYFLLIKQTAKFLAIAIGILSGMNYQPIENYGIIGNLQTIALVGLDGSIDFMCCFEFDSPSIFAALLDNDGGGRFVITPVFIKMKHEQLYLPDTNV